jgi:hypothetical protein
LCTYNTFSSSIHSYGASDYFHSLATLNSAAINMCTSVFTVSWLAFPKIFSQDHMTVLFLVFWGASILFSIAVALIYIPTNPHEVFSPHAHQQLLLFVFLMVAILTGVRWNLIVVLISISFMARDGEHFFMCVFNIWISSFEKVLFSSFANFSLGH